MTLWGIYVQNGNFEKVDRLGSQLSLAIGCPVHYPAYNKPIFECKHGVTFPLFSLEGENWEVIVQRHKEAIGDCP